LVAGLLSKLSPIPRIKILKITIEQEHSPQGRFIRDGEYLLVAPSDAAQQGGLDVSCSQGTLISYESRLAQLVAPEIAVPN
jgi:hypothetical protein